MKNILRLSIKRKMMWKIRDFNFLEKGVVFVEKKLGEKKFVQIFSCFQKKE